MPDDIAGSERMLSQWQSSVQERANRYQAMATRVQGMSITETSADRLVQLTIGSNGILTNLSIAEGAREKRMAELSQEIMRTLQRAQSKIPELLQQAMAETIGTQDETANVLFDEAKKNFPAPPPEEPPPAYGTELRFGVDDDAPSPPRTGPPAPPPRTGPPASPPPAPRRRRDDDDDDFGGESVLT